MCRACKGDFPTEEDYKCLTYLAKGLLSKWCKRGDAATNDAFVREAVELDKIRHSSGAFWGNLRWREEAKQLIFSNPKPAEGLLLYMTCNLINYQMKTETVWSHYLKAAHKWITDPPNDPPRKDMGDLRKHLEKLKDTAIKSGSIANWFADTVTRIVSECPVGQGNIYRFLGYMFRDLLSPPEEKQNKQGSLLRSGSCALLGDWKRLWVIVRGLRRDDSVIKCLLERALETAENGQVAIAYWYDDRYFDPAECQLPVDDWVRENWMKIMSPSIKITKREVARRAMELASTHKVSPSIFDVLFLARE